MIKSLHIQNFQSHQNTELELSNGVNAIVGPSDSGKTAIIRALRWLVWNRPLGDEFRSNWGGNTVVHLDIKSETISRVKTKKDNCYLIEDCLEKTENRFDARFDAIKADVPEEVVRALNMNEINLQQQLDAPFLLSDSPGEVGAHFNRIAHLDVIDIGTKNVQSWTRQIEQDIRSGESHLKQQQEELKNYDHLDKLEKEVEVLESLDQQRSSLWQRIGQLQKLIKSIDEIESIIEQSSVLLKGERLIIDTLKLYEQKHEQDEKINQLTRHIRSIKSIDNMWQVKKQHLKEFEEEFDREFPDVCPLCGKPK
jgi:exonuclease SbcC